MSDFIFRQYGYPQCTAGACHLWGRILGLRQDESGLSCRQPVRRREPLSETYCKTAVSLWVLALPFWSRNRVRICPSACAAWQGLQMGWGQGGELGGGRVRPSCARAHLPTHEQTMKAVSSGRHGSRKKFTLQLCIYVPRSWRPKELAASLPSMAHTLFRTANWGRSCLIVTWELRDHR